VNIDKITDHVLINIRFKLIIFKMMLFLKPYCVLNFLKSFHFLKYV
jgi:hypothetical protein